MGSWKPQDDPPRARPHHLPGLVAALRRFAAIVSDLATRREQQLGLPLHLDDPRVWHSRRIGLVISTQIRVARQNFELEFGPRRLLCRHLVPILRAGSLRDLRFTEGTIAARSRACSPSITPATALPRPYFWSPDMVQRQQRPSDRDRWTDRKHAKQKKSASDASRAKPNDDRALCRSPVAGCRSVAGRR
jgi:hypothetical protein